MATNFFQSYSRHLAYDTEDMAACDHEPLQSCGAIQNAGFLLYCARHDLRVVALSQNFPESGLLGRSLSSLLQLDSGPDISPDQIAALAKLGATPIRWHIDGMPSGSLATFTASDDFLLVEIEQGIEADDPARPEASAIQRLLKEIDSTVSRANEYQLIVTRLKEITGFHRVMIYHFQANWDGEVVAEAVDPGLEPYLHLRYPASDIPAPARALYLDQPYRMIVDSEAEPVAIVTDGELARQAVDLAPAQLRAVSPFHMQYLQNMGVRSAFSVPLKVHGRLWGLISCHDVERPRHLPWAVRSTAELIGRILSGRIANHIELVRLDNRQLTLQFTNQLVAHLGDPGKAMEAFRSHQSALLKLMDAGGVYVRLQGQEERFGTCPDPAIIQRVIQHIQTTTRLGIWKSECLKEDLHLPKAPDQAAGALAIPLAFGFEELIVWFRPEHIQDVRWGGKPDAKQSFTTRLEPRASFQAWVQKVEHRSQPWTIEQDETAQHFHFNFIKGLSARTTALAHANRELERIARARDEFVGMVSHELRTPLSIIIGWIDMLREFLDGSNPDATEAVDVIDRNARLQISLINDLLDISRIVSGKLVLQVQTEVPIHKLVSDVVAALQPSADKKRIQLMSAIEDEVLSAVDPERFRQIINNLITNALKFTPENGLVRVRLQARGAQAILTVEDSGLGLESGQLEAIFERFTQVNSGAKSGLGLGLSIVKSLAELHGGTVRAMSEGLQKGAQFVVSFPRHTEVSAGDNPVAPLMETTKVLAGRWVLLAEDDADATRALHFLLQRLGAHCVSCAHGLAAYGELLSREFDLIISDVGMPKMNGYELLRNWRSYERMQSLTPIPAIALTALAGEADREKALDAGFQSHLAKPVDRSALIAALQGLGFGRAGRD